MVRFVPATFRPILAHYPREMFFSGPRWETLPGGLTPSGALFRVMDLDRQNHHSNGPCSIFSWGPHHGGKRAATSIFNAGKKSSSSLAPYATTLLASRGPSISAKGLPRQNGYFRGTNSRKFHEP